MDQSTARHSGRNDAGFGLIEIMVSMFLLAILSVAFLPIVIRGLTTSVRNTTIATANQLVGEQLDELRALAPNCAAVDSFDDPSVVLATTTDPRGTVFQPFRQVGPCPITYPGTVRVRVWVTENGTELTDAVTLFYVESAVAP